MTIEEIEVSIKDNATKAKAILESEDGIVEDAQKLLDENKNLKDKIEALKGLNEQLLPVSRIEVKATTMENYEEMPKFIPGSLPFEGENKFEKGKKAYAWGKVSQALAGNKAAAKWLGENYASVKAMNETTNSAGGFLVPDELVAQLVFLRDQYGVVRRNADVRTMSSDTLWIPKNSASTTPYWVGDNAAITPSDITFDRIQVLAKKLGILSQISSELSEDAVVEIGAAFAQDVSWKLEQEFDRVMMVGSQANSTDGNIDGFITAVNGVASNVGIVQAATGSAANYNATTLANFRTMVGLLPLYADRPDQVRWYMSKRFYNDVVCNRLDALSGNAALDIQNFQNGTPTLYGYPVEFSQHLASTAAGTANAPLCAFGNLKTGCVYGERRGMEIKTSEHFYFSSDSLAAKVAVRAGFVCHDPGSSTAAGSVIILRRTT